MNWNDAAEDLLENILRQLPLPIRASTGEQIRAAAEQAAGDEGRSRVGVEAVVAGWVRATPDALRADLPRQMDRFGLDPEDYRELLKQ